MQNGFGCEIRTSASSNFCLARMCAGIGGAVGTLFSFRKNFHSANRIAASSNTPSVHQSQASPLEISIGGLMSRMSFTVGEFVIIYFLSREGREGDEGFFFAAFV